MINYITAPFKWFFKLEAASGLVLLIAAIIALIVSNTNFSYLYFDILNSHLLIGTKNFEEVITFAKQLGKLIVVTRGKNGAIAINSNEIVECGTKKNLKIVDLTGAGDLFASGFLHGFVNNLSLKENLAKGTDMSSRVIQIFGARLNN